MKVGKRALKQHAKELLKAQHEFRDALIAMRKQSGMTQKEVAEKMGVSQSAIAQFEHYDANPTLNALRRYALAVGADIEFTVRPRDYSHVVTSTASSVGSVSAINVERPRSSAVKWNSFTTFTTGTTGSSGLKELEDA